MPPKRLTANPKAPLRYRPGKAVGTTESSSSDSESDSDFDADTGAPAKPRQSASKPPPATSFPSFNTAEAEARKRAAAAAAASAEQSVQAAAPDDGFVTASESEGGEAGSSQDESSGGEDIASSESESSSEDERAAAGRPKFVAPKFISKANRAKLAVANSSGSNNNNHDPDADTAAAAAALRQRKADELLEAQIKRDAAARAASQRAFDDDETNNNNGDGTGPQVDDTDGLDAEAEFAAWKLRELLRLQRDRDALVAADRLREETDAYRAMTETERAEVDGAKIAAQNAAKEARGKAGFMARYHHKGAFFQAEDSDSGGAGAGSVKGLGAGEDAEREEMLREIRRRDLMGAKFQDDSAREILPEYMQIRDMTKLGRKGRTKYKDLRNEDTGTWGREERRPFQSQDGYAGRREDDAGPTGANSYAVGERRPRSPQLQSDYGAEKRSRRE